MEIKQDMTRHTGSEEKEGGHGPRLLEAGKGMKTDFAQNLRDSCVLGNISPARSNLEF